MQLNKKPQDKILTEIKTKGLKMRKVVNLTAYYQSFVNLKSNTMKKSRCKDKAYFSVVQALSSKDA